jgi:hypothetical protein
MSYNQGDSIAWSPFQLHTKPILKKLSSFFVYRRQWVGALYSSSDDANGH